MSETHHDRKQVEDRLLVNTLHPNAHSQGESTGNEKAKPRHNNKLSKLEIQLHHPGTNMRFNEFRTLVYLIYFNVSFKTFNLSLSLEYLFSKEDVVLDSFLHSSNFQSIVFGLEEGSSKSVFNFFIFSRVSIYFLLKPNTVSKSLYKDFFFSLSKGFYFILFKLFPFLIKKVLHSGHSRWSPEYASIV